MHEELIKQFLIHVSSYNKEDYEKIKQAAYYADEKHQDQKRRSGEPYLIHPLAVAEILISLRSDADTVCGGLLHDTVEDTDATLEEIRELFGDTVSNMVEGETKISSIKAQNKNIQEAATIRKLFFTMSNDIRVIIIKLADKLHNMRTLEFLDRTRAKEIAQECLDIYSPLADRLGIAWIKTELENLSLKILKPDVYKYIEDFLNSKQVEHKKYIERISKVVQKKCYEAGYKVKIVGRTKHIYSIHQKMKKRNKDIEDIYDLFGIRILCDTPADCYILLGIIHSIWLPIEGRFKDYIAIPKSNNYQSLHTTVVALEGKIIEIQVRTFEMDQIADFGVASHTLYKAKTGSAHNWNPNYNVDIYSRLKNWKTEIQHSDSFMDDIKSELLKDTIIVFTPKGNPIDLPVGSTSLDFAFKIHTEVGFHTTGAKANGSIIPLGQPLKHTQVIEILTSPQAHPKLSWLKLAHNNSTKGKIRAWLNKNDEGLLLQKNIIAKTKKEEKKEAIEEPEIITTIKDDEIIRHVNNTTNASLVVGKEKNLLISLAHCCNPTPGDKIIGYVSRGRGIIVHRQDCPNLKNMTEIDQRSIEVEWETESTMITKRFRLTAHRTTDLFSEIEGAIKKYNGHLLEGKLNDTDDGNFVGNFIMECDREESFKKIIKNLRAIPNIIQIAPRI